MALIERTETPTPTRPTSWSGRRPRRNGSGRRSTSQPETASLIGEWPQTSGGTGATQGPALFEPGVKSDETEAAEGRKLLFADARVAFLLLNEARYRTLERLFGVGKDQANAATLVVGLVLADALREQAARMLRGPALPSFGDASIGASALRELVYGIAGPSSRDAPLVGTLIAVGVLGHLARPVVGQAVHGIRDSSQRFHGAFNHRYGHLVGTGRLPLDRARSFLGGQARHQPSHTTA
jgi:hypothetical protein